MGSFSNGDVIRSVPVCCGCGHNHGRDDDDCDDVDNEDDDDDCCEERNNSCCDEDDEVSQVSFGATLLSISSVTEYLNPPGLGGGAATATAHPLVMSVRGSLSKLRIQQSTVSTDATPVIYTVFKNGLATRLTATVAGNVASGKDSRHHVRVRPGDLITVQVVHGAFPSTVAVGNVVASMALSSES